ncbi:MAG: hypothetical protein M1554_02520 [Patescibacteria group bacterium]|jgi:hypothetical protein|nr:hypothetical protein [Patescibacteria group bacterium]
MDSNNKLGISQLLENLKKGWAVFNKFKILIFIIFIGFSYTYLFLQVNGALNQNPVSSPQTQVGTPAPGGLFRINPKIVNQLESLKNNSVNVQVLFAQARNNPFE